MGLRSIKHWLAHRTGWNEGDVVSGWDDHGHLFVWFACRGCGKISGVHQAPDWIANAE
jgi:hypothetical protein